MSVINDVTLPKGRINYPKRKNLEVTYSLPKDLLRRIEAERGDIPRSKYVLRLIEKGYGKEDE